ncbi:MAG: Tim44-like domain-containing protein [Firmicutes bacterium]|nr:Tim44-like domain-containing protein [[Eubacterium] siraeum]MCM1487184.1 Tim44-like domain-containing protein [Bacillota bacterium]
MKKKILTCLASILLVAISLCVSLAAFDGNDYGGGDFGGGDWGGGDWGGGDSYYDSDWGSSSSSGGGFGIIGSIPVIVIVIVIIIIANSKKNSGSTAQPTVRPGQGSQGANVILPNRNDQIQSIIRKKDPNFTADDFVTFAKQVYIDIEMAWCNRDLTPVRPVMHQNLYNTTMRQIEDKIKQGIVYHYESIAINTAYLTSFVRDKDFEYLTVYLNARMIDYQVDEKTGNILRGDKTTRWDMRYKMKFVRSTNATTKDVEETHGYNCPNCGAPLEITSSGTCPYCNSVVTTGDYSWVLTDFTTVRNDTVDDGVRVPPEDLQ